MINISFEEHHLHLFIQTFVVDFMSVLTCKVHAYSFIPLTNISSQEITPRSANIACVTEVF